MPFGLVALSAILASTALEFPFLSGIATDAFAHAFALALDA
jgi:hypothetical protein